MNKTSPKYKFFENIDFLLAFGSSEDLTVDDLFRNSIENKIKSALVYLNWDSAVNKTILTRPDYLLTWGKQTADLAKKIHNIESIPFGSLRLEIYKKINYTHKYEIDFSNNFKYLLFAGSGVVFAENTLLKLLDDLIISKNLNIKIIYKQHPHAWKRYSEKLGDINSLKNVIPYKSTKSDFLLYPHLFSKISGLITPYSTMMIDASLNGLPVLAVGYDDEEHKEFNWKKNLKRMHLNIFFEAQHILHCHEKKMIPNYFEEFLKLIENKSISIKAKDFSLKLIENSKYSYIERIKHLIKNKDK